MLTTIIEQYLLAVDQGTFQKMINHLLYLDGYKFIGSPGSVVGKNKTSKGSPDSYFFEDKDGFAFCEQTTKEKLKSGQSFLKKLQSDVEHCFDVGETGIEKKKVTKVILAFTQKISPQEFSRLNKQVQKHNSAAELILYSIQEIPFRLIYYPGLADKYIPGVKTTNSTLYTLPDFLKTTDRGLQPALTNPFSCREKEIEVAKTKLLSNDILIIKGGQGVGKSKIAVRLAEIFENEFGYEPRVIVGSPVSVWEDLQNFLLPTKKYLIFFDDANKALPNLDYLLQLIKSRDLDSIKVVITVRDYVRQDIEKTLFNSPHSNMELKPLQDKEIKEIVQKSLPKDKALNPLVMEKILSLSKGNSRLALMASSSILKNEDTRILKDVFSLYQQYFKIVKSDVSFLDKPDHLKALGILSFLGVMDRDNESVKEVLQNHFDTNWDLLWETFNELEKSELVIVFHNETAKISDQVLATFAFYKTFIDQDTATLDYSEWLYRLIENFEKRINKTVVDLINTFGYEELRDQIQRLIAPVQGKLENDPIRLQQFFGIFWFYREIDCLLWIKNGIENLEEDEVDLAEIKYDYDSNDFVWAPDHIKLLINFWSQNNPYVGEAIDLALKLMFKQTAKIPETLKHLSEHISFNRFDYKFDFPRQHALIDRLNNKSFDLRQQSISDNLFLSMASQFLQWDYTQMGGNGGTAVTFYNFQLIKTPALMQLRQKILEKLFVLFPTNESKVIEILHKYAWNSNDFDSSVYADEQPMITAFFKKYFEIDNYPHCKLIQVYTKMLKQHSISISEDWTDYINSSSMQIAEVFSWPEYDKALRHEDREQKQKENIKAFILRKDLAFVEATLNQLDSIYRLGKTHKDKFWINQGLSQLLMVFAESDVKLYFDTLELLMVRKYSFRLNHGYFIVRPIRDKLVPALDLYHYLNQFDFEHKQFWNQSFFEAIKQDQIDTFYLCEFITFLNSVEGNFCLYDFESFIKFDKQFNEDKQKLEAKASNHTNFLTYIAELLLSKNVSNEISFEWELCRKNSKYFDGKEDLLKRIFYLQQLDRNNHDWSGSEIAAISSIDDNFLVEYLQTITKSVSNIDLHFGDQSFNFLWDLPNHENLANNALDLIISKAPIFSNFKHPANILFQGEHYDENKEHLMLGYIDQFIAMNCRNKQRIHIILNVVTYSFNAHVYRFVKQFLLLNKNPEFVKSLWLEGGGVFSGSRVPRIEATIKHYKTLIAMIRTLPEPLDYAEHLKYWEQQIQWSEQDKAQEMKRDFVGWDG